MVRNQSQDTNELLRRVESELAEAEHQHQESVFDVVLKHWDAADAGTKALYCCCVAGALILISMPLILVTANFGNPAATSWDWDNGNPPPSDIAEVLKIGGFQVTDMKRTGQRAYEGMHGSTLIGVTYATAANDSHKISYQSKRRGGELYTGNDNAFWGSVIVQNEDLERLRNGEEISGFSKTSKGASSRINGL